MSEMIFSGLLILSIFVFIFCTIRAVRNITININMNQEAPSEASTYAEDMYDEKGDLKKDIEEPFNVDDVVSAINKVIYGDEIVEEKDVRN